MHGVAQLQRRQRVDRLARNHDMPGLASQARALAFRALLHIQVFGEFFAHYRRVGFAVPPLQVGDDALKRMFADVRLAALAGVGELDLRLAGPIEHSVARLFRQFVERCFDVEPVVCSQALQHLEIELVAAVPALDGAGGQGHLREGGDPFRIEKADGAKAVAALAGARRVVEREQPWFQFRRRVAAMRAGEAR